MVWNAKESLLATALTFKLLTGTLQAADQPYQAIVESLRPLATAEGEVLLVPRMNPVEGVAFRDVYDIFVSGVVGSLVARTGDLQAARKIAAFYLQLFQGRSPELYDASDRFRGFPEAYKDKCGPENLCGPIEPDPGLQIRGSGPNAWLGVFFLNYLEIETDMDRRNSAISLMEALADWFMEIQMNDPSRPWLDGGIAGGTDEQTGEIIALPSTEGNTAVYAFLRRLQILESNQGNQEMAERLRTSADRLAEWFRSVIDPATGRVLVGRTVDGDPVEGRPGATADSVDVHALCILSGLVDQALALKMIDHVIESGAYMKLRDTRERILSGLAFGAEGDTIYFGPTGQVLMAAMLIGHPWADQLLADMRNAAIEGKLPVFVRPFAWKETDRVRDWSGQLGDEAWVGNPENFALEPTAFLAYQETLPGANIMAPSGITWDPKIANDPQESPTSNPPSVLAIVNGASFIPGKNPLAPGTIASIFGQNLNNSSIVPAPVLLGGRLLTVLAGARVALEGIPAPLFSSHPGQINIQIPHELGEATTALFDVEVMVGGRTSSLQDVPLGSFSAGIFTIPPGGTGQAAALISNTSQLAAPIGNIPGVSSRPVAAGENISIFATGLGEVTNRPGTGVPASENPLSATTANPQVTIGDVPASVLFSGLAPHFVGLYQINVEVPQGVLPGPEIPIVLTMPEQTPSNSTTIAVAQPAPLMIPAEPVNWISDPLTPTGVIVSVGTRVRITASGSWSAGRGFVGPDGEPTGPLAACPVSTPFGSGWRCTQLGSLIGRWGKPGDALQVGAGNPFLVGSEKVVVGIGAELYLGMNDNLEACDGVNRGSCYRGNLGSLSVTIERLP